MQVFVSGLLYLFLTISGLRFLLFKVSYYCCCYYFHITILTDVIIMTPDPPFNPPPPNPTPNPTPPASSPLLSCPLLLFPHVVQYSATRGPSPSTLLPPHPASACSPLLPVHVEGPVGPEGAWGRKGLVTVPQLY